MIGRLITAVVATCALVGLAACASSGRDRTASTVSGLTALRDNADAGKKSVQSTLSALAQVEKGPGALAARYEAFVNEFGALEALAAKARSDGASMREDGAAYFAAWEKELGTVTNAAIRERSEARRAELNELYGALTAAMDTCRERYDRFETDLRDIRTGLDLDLTPGGVKSLSGPMSQARSDGAAVDEAIDGVLSELEKLAKELREIQAPSGS